MIKKYSLLVLQKAINQALALDEGMPLKMKDLKSRTLRIIISPLDVSFFLCFTENALELRESYEGESDATIQSSPLGLIRLSLLPASKVRSLFNDSIRISGDVELGQRVKALFDGVDIDWEGHLARFTGDVVAHQIGTFVRKGTDFGQHLSQSLRASVTEYLQEEARLFPAREEVDDFFNDVDALSLRVERLSAHVHILSESHESD